MSGFAGFFDMDGTVKEDQYLWTALVRRMLRRVMHRGSGKEKVHISRHCAAASIGTAVGEQTYCYTQNRHRCFIAFDGKLSNRDTLREELQRSGLPCTGDSDAEIVLKAYICFSEQCAEKLDGSYAFFIDDEEKNILFLCRDRFGAKPLFYTHTGDRLVFCSEIKGLFEYPGTNPVLDRDGIHTLLGFGGMHLPESAIFKGIFSLAPGHYAVCSKNGWESKAYWQLRAKPFHFRSSDEIPINTAAKQNTDSSTEKTTDFAQEHVLRLLTETVIARDLPTFGSAALGFYDRLKKNDGTASLPYMQEYDAARIFAVINSGTVSPSALSAYISAKNEETRLLCPVLRGEASVNRLFRQRKFVFLHGVLPHLLELFDRYSSYTGHPEKVLFINPEKAEAFFDLPYGMANPLPGDVFPINIAVSSNMPSALSKTAKKRLYALLSDASQPLHRLIDRGKLLTLLRSDDPANIDLFLWILQLSLWLNHYRVRIEP